MAKRSAKQDAAPNGGFDALRQFFSGYLHQDFRDEYGSATEAAKAFRDDADPAELAALRADWKKWWNVSQHFPLPEIQKSMHELGAAWLPQSSDEIRQVGAALAETSS
jgi:hypothetical protein